MECVTYIAQIAMESFFLKRRGHLVWQFVEKKWAGKTVGDKDDIRW